MMNALREIATNVRKARRLSGFRNEEGGSLVEMGIACMILIPVLLGIVELSFALYCFHYAADAAREGSRFAMVRGANCTGNFSKAYCSPTDAQPDGADGNDVAQYVKSLGYPYSGAVTTTTQWCVRTGKGTWGTCSTTKSNGTGNLVKVTVSYAYPIAIPFFTSKSINLTSTSSMTIVQ